MNGMELAQKLLDTGNVVRNIQWIAPATEFTGVRAEGDLVEILVAPGTDLPAIAREFGEEMDGAGFQFFGIRVALKPGL